VVEVQDEGNSSVCLDLTAFHLDNELWHYNTCAPSDASLGECELSFAGKVCPWCVWYVGATVVIVLLGVTTVVIIGLSCWIWGRKPIKKLFKKT
jgi:hypothetical protein